MLHTIKKCHNNLRDSISGANLRLDLSRHRYQSRLRLLEVQFERLAKIRQRFALGVPLTGYVHVETLRYPPDALLPYTSRKCSLQNRTSAPTPYDYTVLGEPARDTILTARLAPTQSQNIQPGGKVGGRLLFFGSPGGLRPVLGQPVRFPCSLGPNVASTCFTNTHPSGALAPNVVP